ncbi:DUF4270 family protein [Pedobacter sp. Du54]|uniref:DUF4270 family protein n=1 Tax=Pedobacter anseongensis TaxID=3133439 RepID=UPI0030A8DFB8
MKFTKLDLLTLLISLFLFASCENTSTIGLEIDPTSKVEGALVDTLTIASRTEMDEVIATNNLTRHPLGYLKDPIFGTSESSLSFSIGLPSTAFTFGAFNSLDSAVLVLNYAGEFYGDSTLTYSFDVHQLNSNITLNESFPSNKEYGVYNEVIGNKTGRLYPNTKFKINDIVVGGKDTLRSVVPQIRIKLDPNFVVQNLISLTANNNTIKNDFTLASFINGLRVQVNKTLSTGNGGMAFFDFENAASNLSIYYKKDAVGGGAIDTTLVTFPISKTANKVASTIKHNYVGTPIETQLNNPNQQYAVTYLQPMVGLRNKISFPSLSKFSSNIGKIVVNKAELVIDLASGTDTQPFEAAPRLSLYRYDIAEQRGNLPDNSPTTDVRGFQDPSIFGGYFNSLTRQYVFVITSYIQDLINNKTKDYGTFLAPTPTNEFLVTPSLTSAARAVIGANKKNPAAGESTMKLNIYYTKVN